MGALSNNLLVVTIVSYIFAMLAYAVEYAFGERKVLVTAGAPASPSPVPTRAGVVGVSLSVVGVAFHAATLVTRGLAAGRVPWGNMYEFVMAVTLVGSVAWLVVLSRWPRLRHLGLYVT